MSERLSPLRNEAGPVSGLGAETVSLEQASQLLDVPVGVIRSWDRRYRFLLGDSAAEGDRRYDVDALRVLRLLRDYLASGHGAAATATTPQPQPDRLVSALIDSARHLQPYDVHHLLDVAEQALGLDRMVDEVLLPALREVGRLWADGLLDVAQEHVATQAVQAWLADVSRSAAVPVRSQTIVLACGPRDLHTIGLEALGVLLERRGWNCLLLGARTPVESLARTVRDLRPAAVVLVCHLARTRAAAVRSLRSAGAYGVPLFVAGGAFDVQPTGSDVPATYLGGNLFDAAELITARLGAAAA